MRSTGKNLDFNSSKRSPILEKHFCFTNYKKYSLGYM